MAIEKDWAKFYRKLSNEELEELVEEINEVREESIADGDTAVVERAEAIISVFHELTWLRLFLDAAPSPDVYRGIVAGRISNDREPEQVADYRRAYNLAAGFGK